MFFIVTPMAGPPPLRTIRAQTYPALLIREILREIELTPEQFQEAMEKL